MSYVIELLFTPEAEAKIHSLWYHIAQAGFPSPLDAVGYRPHLTLAVSDAPIFHTKRCQEELKELIRARKPFPIRLNHLGLFQTMNNVVFLGVIPSRELLDLHQAVFSLCQGIVSDWRNYYAPDHWTPHVTLAFELTPQQALGILNLAWEFLLPIEAHARALQAVEVTSRHARDLFRLEFYPGSKGQ